jgi:DnaJ homolog subfamily C member 27
LKVLSFLGLFFRLFKTLDPFIILSQLEHGRESNFTKGKIVITQLISVGDTKVGKSCIIKRYCEGRFVQKYITTIGVDYGVKKVTVSGRKIAVNFFDLSGSSDYEEIRNPFYEDAQVILLIFDL